MARALIRWCCACLVLLGLGGCTPEPSGTRLQVKAIGVLDRFAPFEPVVGSAEIALFAARNEYEGFQFVITAGGRGAAKVQSACFPVTQCGGR
ncbi:MAG: hypothetical protein BWK73_54230 [Thiothrix lacustris]|uniref:Uncharacterized protein n=1 Tax=Thiothrix lacustris TaxID=525917 RepID=A0A1Y1Q6V7_9GAMM|nr:MAG: hypothetical protein BWK73_54230 [Thiothrix lacustris]